MDVQVTLVAILQAGTSLLMKNAQIVVVIWWLKRVKLLQTTTAQSVTIKKLLQEKASNQTI